jgi:hypothetical protein
MPIDLYGDKFLTEREYARKLVTKGVNLPFYHYGISPYSWELLTYCQTENGEPISQTFLERPGLYAIFQKNEKSGIECLYVGISHYSVRYRLYRFVKELVGMSRQDENHPAAEKARNAGVKPDNLLIKFLPLDEFPTVDVRSKIDNIDEHIASLLKAKYNTRVHS